MFAELMFAPVFGRIVGGLLIFRAITVIVLLAALSAAGVRRTVLFLCVPVLVIDMVASYAGVVSVEVVSTLLHALFLACVFGFILSRVARADAVSLDTIAGAACAYLLIALIWGDLYLLVELWHPGSFQIPSNWIIGSNRDLRASLTYFSFVSLTTVGRVFDVVDPATGGLCVAETLLGQLYLAVLIARMVGLHTSQRTT
jgi:hypothetical protein